MRYLYILPLCLFCFASCKGQNDNPLQTFSSQSKLIKQQEQALNDNVHWSLQDKNGNLWFGTTKQGVYRYDGKSFTNFTIKDGLSSNTVYAGLEDNAGIIWLGTDKGICRYDGKGFSNLSMANGSQFLVNPANSKPTLQSTVICMLQDKRGKIWVGTRDAVYCYDGTSFTRFLQNDGVINNSKLTLNSVQCMLQDKKGNIWFCTWFEGLCRYDGKELVNFKPNNEVWYGGLYEDKQGRIWAGRRGKGVVYYDGRTFNNLVQGGAFDECGVIAIMQDEQGNMWFGTEAGEMTMRETIGGIWKYDGKTFSNFLPKGNAGSYCVFSLVQDNQGNIWAGTRGTGLYRYNGKDFIALSE